MTYKNGFIGGAIIGVFLTLIAIGRIIVVEFTETSRVIAFLILFSIFIVGQYVTAYRAFYGRSCFGTTEDGAIVGIGFMEAMIIFLLYGFRL